MKNKVTNEFHAMKLEVLAIFFLVGLLPMYAMGQAEKEKNSGTLSIYLENDSFAGTDRQYTNGVKLCWISSDLKANRENSRLSGWIYSLTKRLFFVNRPEFQHAVSISIGQNIYTPDDIERSNLVKEDRPYAGIAYIGIGFHSQNSCRMTTLEFDLGIVGPHSYAEEHQKFIHKLTNATHPNGWHNQLKDELVLGVSYDHEWKLLRSGIGDGFGYDLITHMGGGLGNAYTSVFTGMEVRLGWSLPNDFGTFLIHPCGDSKDVYDKRDSHFIRRNRFGIHFFAAVDGQAVLQEIFLDGNTFRDSHRVEKKPFRVNIMAGVALNISRFKISYAHVYQAKRFKTQRKEHVYGSINLSYFY